MAHSRGTSQPEEQPLLLQDASEDEETRQARQSLATGDSVPALLEHSRLSKKESAKLSQIVPGAPAYHEF